MEDHVFFLGLWADEGGEVGGGCETLEREAQQTPELALPDAMAGFLSQKF